MPYGPVGVSPHTSMGRRQDGAYGQFVVRGPSGSALSPLSKSVVVPREHQRAPSAGYGTPGLRHSSHLQPPGAHGLTHHVDYLNGPQHNPCGKDPLLPSGKAHLLEVLAYYQDLRRRYFNDIYLMTQAHCENHQLVKHYEREVRKLLSLNEGKSGVWSDGKEVMVSDADEQQVYHHITEALLLQTIGGQTPLGALSLVNGGTGIREGGNTGINGALKPGVVKRVAHLVRTLASQTAEASADLRYTNSDGSLFNEEVFDILEEHYGVGSSGDGDSGVSGGGEVMGGEDGDGGERGGGGGQTHPQPRASTPQTHGRSKRTRRQSNRASDSGYHTQSATQSNGPQQQDNHQRDPSPSTGEWPTPSDTHEGDNSTPVSSQFASSENTGMLGGGASMTEPHHRTRQASALDATFSSDDTGRGGGSQGYGDAHRDDALGIRGNLSQSMAGCVAQGGGVTDVGGVGKKRMRKARKSENEELMIEGWWYDEWLNEVCGAMSESDECE
eukprot:GHVN01025928.1.p1 GENE.GHVN01025928.1~~GHVN01025928.1.p1  ORF type:complete len:531 (-),score=146.95 GHVN01025928.1:334-1830(-)